MFDRRECGQSGGRVEPVTWAHYVAQGKGLLDHLRIARAHLIGGCMGCAPVAAFAVAHPEMVASLVLYWPVGGAKYRISSHQRFAEHLDFVRSDGLAGVVALVRKEGKPFGADPRGGPWASVIKRDERFRRRLCRTRHCTNTSASARRCAMPCSTAIPRPAPTPEDLMRADIPALIVPGHDAAHATSAARYLEECLPRSDYWDAAVDAQTEDRDQCARAGISAEDRRLGGADPMVDYYSLLLRAVTAPGAGDAQWRRGIYDRARRMLASRLRTLRPPPPLAEIAAEEAALEAAIERIESELSWTEHGAIAPDARTHDRFGDIDGEPWSAREQGLVATPSRSSRGGWIVVAIVAAALGAGGYVSWLEMAQKSAPPPSKAEAQNAVRRRSRQVSHRARRRSCARRRRRLFRSRHALCVSPPADLLSDAAAGRHDHRR